MKALRILSGLLFGLTLSTGRSGWAEQPRQVNRDLGEVCVAKGNKNRKKASAIDEYGGHCGGDGFYYDRFGGHYEKYGYEYKDGSFKSRCGERYDAKSNKIFENDGSERAVPPDLTSPKDQKALIRTTCEVAFIEHEGDEESNKTSDTRAVTPPPMQPPDTAEPLDLLDVAQVLRPVQFALGSAKLKDGAGDQPSLRAISAFLAQRRDVAKLQIEGHACNSGTDEKGLALSRRRALAIKDQLVKMGVESERLVPVAFGNARPIADNATAAGRARNERVEFRIAELNRISSSDVNSVQAQPR